MSIEPVTAAVPPAPAPAAPAVEAPTPATAAPREGQRPGGGEREGRLQARQVQRIVRHVDVWSVVKVAFAFWLCAWLAVTVAGALLWWVAAQTGLVANVEGLVAELLAEQEFTVDGGAVLRASLLGGVVMVAAGTALAALAAVLLNLICQLTGGVRVAVVEVETARPAREPTGSLGSERIR